MISKIAIYNSHDSALEAVNSLKKAGFLLDNVSLIGEAHIINDHMHLRSLEPLKNMPVALGAVAGLVTGLLSGIGIFAIPGFGFLFGAGAIVGAIGGLDLGIMGGGLATIFLNMGIKKEEVLKYEEHIKAGRFLLVVKGTPTEISRAEKILHVKDANVQLDQIEKSFRTTDTDL
jgi:hypothetical protein